MTSRPDSVAQRASFNELVEQGVFTEYFEHRAVTRTFFEAIIREHTILRGSGVQAGVLECGCGTGAWLSDIARIAESRANRVDLYGFDIAERMVELARSALVNHSGAVQIRVGDFLDSDIYRFPDVPNGFDLVYAFDAVQQLPPGLHFPCVERMLEHVRVGGRLLLFDNDALSMYGYAMTMKKFATRYLGLRLVPRYYCNAHYPPLAAFVKRLRAMPGVRCDVFEEPVSPKTVLVVTKTGDAPP